MPAPTRLSLVPPHPDAEPPASTPPPPPSDLLDAYVGLTGRLPLRRLAFHLHYGLPAYQGNRDDLRIRHLNAVN